MAMTLDEKLELKKKLFVGFQKADELTIRLMFKGEDIEAKKVEQKANELKKELDILTGQVLEDWLAQTNVVIAEVSKANSSLQQSIRKIERGVKITENVVNAIGFIDDLIATATRISSAFV